MRYERREKGISEFLICKISIVVVVEVIEEEKVEVVYEQFN